MVLSFESYTLLVVSSIFHVHPRNGTMIPTDFMLHTSCFLGVAQALVSNPDFPTQSTTVAKEPCQGPSVSSSRSHSSSWPKALTGMTLGWAEATFQCVEHCLLVGKGGGLVSFKVVLDSP